MISFEFSVFAHHILLFIHLGHICCSLITPFTPCFVLKRNRCDYRRAIFLLHSSYRWQNHRMLGLLLLKLRQGSPHLIKRYFALPSLNCWFFLEKLFDLIWVILFLFLRFNLNWISKCILLSQFLKVIMGILCVKSLLVTAFLCN